MDKQKPNEQEPVGFSDDTDYEENQERETEDKSTDTDTCKKGRKGHSALENFVAFLSILLAFLMGGVFAIFASRHFLPTTSTKLDEINALVRKHYSGEIDNALLEDALATAYMDSIGDKYSFYKDAEDTNLVENSLKGTGVGMGATILVDPQTNSLIIYRVDANSPADKAGMKPKDKILAIDNKSVKKMGLEKSVNAMKREIGEKAEFTILRGDKTLKATINYEDFIQQSVYYEIIDNYGYLTITAFNNNTVPQFKKAYKYLTEQKVKGLIFDVRNNGGGTVDSVCEILDLLVGKCDLITVLYADGSKNVSQEAKSDADKCDLPMAVLINENTASAAELFAANLRDMAKAPLIGNNTYGKGVVQRTYFLDDGSCIRFTIGEFLPAGGKGFDGEGLPPDYEVNFSKEEAANPYFLGADEPYLKKAMEILGKIIEKEK